MRIKKNNNTPLNHGVLTSSCTVTVSVTVNVTKTPKIAIMTKLYRELTMS